MSARAPRARRLLTARALLIALMLLLALDVVLRLPGAPWFPRDFRMPSASVSGFDEYVEYMRTQPGLRVAVVGDSLAQGLFANADQTWPADLDRLFLKAGQHVRAYNFGISAAHAPDLFAAVSRISSEKAADVIVVDFNYPFMLEPTSTPAYNGARFAALFKHVQSWVPYRNDPLVSRWGFEPDRRTLPQKARDVLASVWRLYGSRDAYAAILFGESAPEAVRTLYSRLVDGPPKPVDLRVATAKLRQTWEGKPFSDSNVQLSYFRMMLVKARLEGIPVVVIAGSGNLPLLEQRGVLTRAVYDSNMAYARRMVVDEGATFVDITGRIPGNEIGDSVHPLPKGYAIMADATKAALDPIVARLQQAKGR